MIDNVHSTMTRSSGVYRVMGVINKPSTVELCISPIPTTFCGEIFQVHNVADS